MNTNLVEPSVGWRPNGGRPGRMVVFAVKLAVTILCFSYIGSRIDVNKARDAVRMVDFGWLFLAMLALVLHLPLVSLRWCNIVDALGPASAPVHRPRMLAITAIAAFFGQLMPSVASEGLRAWMLVPLGPTWRRAFASVLIDRAVGVGVFAILSLMILLAPSPLRASLPQAPILTAAFAAITVCGLASLAMAPFVAMILQRWRYTAWAADLVRATHDMMLKSSAGFRCGLIAAAIGLLAITSVWFLARGIGFGITIVDAGVLFTVIFGSMLIPISIAGWGIRELAVAGVLASQGVPLERSVTFSVCFGLTLLAASLPGAIVWVMYSPLRPSKPAQPW